MHKLGKVLHPLVFGLILAAAAFIRFRVAPLSAGPDVAQFWSFAEVFRLYGLDFYRYASAEMEIFSFQYWAYVYPPIWLLLLALARLAAPLSSATGTMVDASWRLAMKTPIIMADLAIGGLLYWAIPGPKMAQIAVCLPVAF